jgi:hypothetical protein
VTNGGRGWGEKEARRGLTLSRGEAYSSCDPCVSNQPYHIKK